MRRATIDIGSNTTLLLLGEVSPYREIAKLSEVTALGKGLDKNGIFSEASMEDTYRALAHYRDLCRSHGVPPEAIIATATEASRVARNAPEFYARVRRELGIDVKIITGAAEATLTTKGVLFDGMLEGEEALIMDIGGASTEFIRVRNSDRSILSLVSLPVGSVRASDWLAEGAWESRLTKILSEHAVALTSLKSAVLHCVAGTVTSLGNMHLGHKSFVEDEVHGLRLTLADVERLLDRCGEWEPEKFLSEFPFLGKRSQAIRGGLFLCHALIRHQGVREMVVSTYGLRYGTFLEGEVKREYLA